MDTSGNHRSRRIRFIWRNSSSGSRKSIWIDRKTETHTRLMAIMFFCGIALIVAVGAKTLISWLTITRIMAAIGVVSSFIPQKYFPIIYRVRKELKVIFIIFALTPLLTGLILFSNFLIIPETKVESYKIVKVQTYANDYLFNVHLEDSVYEEFKQIRSFSSYDFSFYPDSVHYITGKGIFRLKVIRDAYLTPLK